MREEMTKMLGLRSVGALALVVLLSAATFAESPVADAAMRRQIETVRALLKKGADVNAPQGDGMTALHWAARHGDVPMVALLLGGGANVKAVTRIGAHTALHVASEVGNAPVVGALLKAGSDPKAATTTGVTPLHLAAMAGNVAALKALLDAGADVNAGEPTWGQTALMIAAAHGRTDAVKLLLQRGADHKVAAKVVDLMSFAAGDRQGRAARNKVLADFREKQGSPQVWNPTPTQVQAAVQAGLIAEKQSPAAVAAAASGAAASADPEEETRARGADEEAPGFTQAVGFQGGLTPLLLAVREGHAETVRALLDGGADINQAIAADHTTPLLLATINGHYDLAKYLVERGADVKAASDAGATPLYAVLNKEWAPSSRTPQPAFHLQQKTTYLELMAAFLKAGADPNARLKKSLWYTTYNRDNLRVDFSGATPFWRAAYATDLAAMKLLLANGADPKVPTLKPPARGGRGGRGGAPGAGGEGRGGGGGYPDAARGDQSGLPPVPDGGPGVYPIHAASGVGYGQGYAANDHRHVPDAWLATVKFLVEELGADVNARDHAGYTPLHNAAARGDNEMINYLVSKGADVKAVARNGQTTVDMANGPVQRISPFLDTVALLEKLGAKNNHKCMSC
jgi:ankyrin repeat protein